MSHVACHMSHVTCHVSHVICHMSHVFKKNLTKWWSLSVEGLLSTGPTLSNFIWCWQYFEHFFSHKYQNWYFLLVKPRFRRSLCGIFIEYFYLLPYSFRNHIRFKYVTKKTHLSLNIIWWYHAAPIPSELTTRTRTMNTQILAGASFRGCPTKNTFKSTFEEHFQLPLASSFHNLKGGLARYGQHMVSAALKKF